MRDPRMGSALATDRGGSGGVLEGQVRTCPQRYAPWRQARDRHRRRPGEPAVPRHRRALGQTAPPLRVRTLGAFVVWCGEHRVAARCWHEPKVTSLFKILLSAPGHRLAREQVSALLWPEEREAAGDRLRSRLGYTLSHLRDVLQHAAHLPASRRARQAYVRFEGDDLVLDPSPQAHPPAAWLDAETFAALAAHALATGEPEACRRARAAYAGEYLPEERYADWSRSRREILAQRYMAVLRALALATQERAPEEAIEALQTMLRRDPCAEDASALLMQIYARQGQRSLAIREYRTLAAALRRQLGVAPSAGVTRRYRALVEQAGLPAVTGSSLLSGVRSPVPGTAKLAQDWQEVVHLVAESRFLTLTCSGDCDETRRLRASEQAVLFRWQDSGSASEFSPRRQRQRSRARQ